MCAACICISRLELTWLDLTWLDLTCRSSSYATIVCCISILIYCTLHYHSVWWFYTLSLYACVHLVIFHLTLHHLVSCIMLCSTTSHTILYFSTVSFCMVFHQSNRFDMTTLIMIIMLYYIWFDYVSFDFLSLLVILCVSVCVILHTCIICEYLV